MLLAERACFLFTDVVTIEKTDENFRLLYNTKGRFVLHPLRHTQEAEVRRSPALTACA